ncbi:hypothetical protein CROQUDRAFT_724967 [Cronartium quercuum f. sp. fusiforme G11]|uniref:Uncharacterized protein n=1 Tax=Cronartium quercuum f. sp. fusiforme G11 TaxID=708437 RepID=A0A9P6T846_9BASI|nr:hypothetical protein CROQUDRAFT_724967 [Cronartium quercuum f. sp. fusiforme G11]
MIPPFTISSHPAFPESAQKSHTHPTSLHPQSLATKPVLRFLRSGDKKQKLNSSSESSQVITTVPAEGWSIHNVSTQTVLSSQKLSPHLALSAPCVAVSIPKAIDPVLHEPTESSSSLKKLSKPRLRYVYGAVASSPAHPPGPVNEGRTVWVWIEAEVSGGYGERLPSTSTGPETESGVNLIKEFESRVQMIHVIPTHTSKPQHGQQNPSYNPIVRIVVLLETGHLALCDQDLSIIMTCRSSSSAFKTPSLTQQPTTPTSSPHGLLRIQALEFMDEHQSSATLSHSLRPYIRSSTSILLYVTRAHPVWCQIPDESATNLQLPNGPTKKRKPGLVVNTPAQKSAPQLSHYSNLQIDVYEFAMDHIQPFGNLTSKEDLFDLAIGAHGWLTILGCDQLLKTYQLAPATQTMNENLLSPRTLSLISHVKFPPLDISPCFTVKGAGPKLNPLPTLLPQHLTTPIVILLMPHSTSPKDTASSCLCLMIDLYHRAVLHSHHSSWPSLQSQETSPHSPTNPGKPFMISSELSSLYDPAYVYMAQSGVGRRLVQAFQLPKSSPSGPTWADVLDPAVVKATATWIRSATTTSDTTMALEIVSDEKSLPDMLLDALPLVERELEPSESRDEQIQQLSTMVKRINEAWHQTPESSGAWDSLTVGMAEEAWNEWLKQQADWATQVAKRKLQPPQPRQSRSILASGPNRIIPPPNRTEVLRAPVESAGKMELDDTKVEPIEKKEKEGDQDLTTHEEKKVKEKRVKKSPKLIQITLTKAFVQTLLKMCLGRFIVTNSESTKEIEEGNLSVVKPTMMSGVYPSKIVSTLLKMTLVEDDMISGGVFVALRRAIDWVNINTAISQMIDIREQQLVETICEVVDFDSKLIVSETTTFTGPEDLGKQSHLRPLLAKIVSQPLSPKALRKALQTSMSIETLFVILKVLDDWIKWWVSIGISNPRSGGSGGDDHTPKLVLDQKISEIGLKMDPDRLRRTLEEKESRKGRRCKAEKIDGVTIPPLEQIVDFVTCCLDSHFIGLIQFRPSHLTLDSILKNISSQINLTQQLLLLNGSLDKFNDQVDKRKKMINKKKKKKKKEDHHKMGLLIDGKGRSKGLGVQVGGRGGGSKKDQSKINKRKEMWEANMALGDYSIEKFVF